MTSKTEAEYVIVITAIKNDFPNLIFMSYMTDFETALLQNAVWI